MLSSNVSQVQLQSSYSFIFILQLFVIILETYSWNQNKPLHLQFMLYNNLYYHGYNMVHSTAMPLHQLKNYWTFPKKLQNYLPSKLNIFLGLVFWHILQIESKLGHPGAEWKAAVFQHTRSYDTLLQRFNLFLFGGKN